MGGPMRLMSVMSTNLSSLKSGDSDCDGWHHPGWQALAGVGPVRAVVASVRLAVPVAIGIATGRRGKGDGGAGVVPRRRRVAADDVQEVVVRVGDSLQGVA